MPAATPGPGEPSGAGRSAGELSSHLAQLLGRAAEGDVDAFADLYEATSSRTYGTVLRVLRAPQHAAEVVQEVYLEVWQKATTYSPGRGSAMGWILTLAHRRAVDRVRSVESDTARDDRWGRAAEDRTADPVWDRVDADLAVELVRGGLQRLTPLQRQSLQLAYDDGCSQSQIARLLDVPLGTVKARMRDGLIALRAHLRAGS
ncbi:RNA polymerase sigma-70 factor, ECF subfamily [Friedmanniella luteola]|uniref:RNA polymerase sigma-70 factor, ECF subfamily n=1 Tax=Friedmanniella luteola TaxID=546871 RepID=A0A1H1SPD3_9ACTN|nr:sigma-70 family RNA polymerase sigma factor [Friedmanniella luteola]SDS49825.1 RNA polymerase sigma-70 factor, ECF subfamily [Friedmanniella luteola]